MAMLLKRLLSNTLLTGSCTLWRHAVSRNLSVGDRASTTKTFTEEDIEQFAEITGDFNPLHFDEDFTAETKFQKPIVHGVLSLGLLSGVLGTQLPGPGTVLMSLNIKFTAPLFVNEEVEVEVEAVHVTERKAMFELTCRKTSDREVTLKGNAHLLLPDSV